MLRGINRLSEGRRRVNRLLLIVLLGSRRTVLQRLPLRPLRVLLVRSRLTLRLSRLAALRRVSAGGEWVSVYHHTAGGKDIKTYFQRQPCHGSAKGKTGAVEHIHITADFRFVNQLIHHHQCALAFAQAGHCLSAAGDAGDVDHIGIHRLDFRCLLSAGKLHQVAFGLRGLLCLHMLSRAPVTAGCFYLRLLKLHLLRGKLLLRLLICLLIALGVGRIHSRPGVSLDWGIGLLAQGLICLLVCGVISRLRRLCLLVVRLLLITLVTLLDALRALGILLIVAGILALFRAHIVGSLGGGVPAVVRAIEKTVVFTEN